MFGGVGTWHGRGNTHLVVVDREIRSQRESVFTVNGSRVSETLECPDVFAEI